MRVIVLGATGLLGSELIATAPAQYSVVGFSRSQLDIQDGQAVSGQITAFRPDIIVNAAAYTAVDRAEAEVALAYAVNHVAVGGLGVLARQHGVRVVHFSTDYVFDGRAAGDYDEDAATNPINVYGKSKLAGEQALRASGADSLLIRTQWLFGRRGRSFPRTMWERAKSHLQSRVVTDQIGRPSYAPDVAAATWQFIGMRVRGTLHLANGSSASWYELAQRIYAACGRPALIHPCSSDDYHTVARRPQRTVLATRRAEELLGGSLPSWEDAIDRFVVACKNESKQ